MAKIEKINIEEIVVVKGFNVRHDAGKKTAALFSLEESIDGHDQVVPVIVNQTADGTLELIAGERRLTAARLAGKEQIEAKVYSELDELAKLELHLIENGQRQALTPIEEAAGMQRLADHGKKPFAIARFFGVSEDMVRNRLSLLKLNPEIQGMIVREKFPLPVHQAQLLAGLADGEALRIARQAAPRTGPVASENQVREWVDEIKKGPSLPGVKRTVLPDGPRPGRPKGSVGNGRVQNNVWTDPDRDEEADSVEQIEARKMTGPEVLEIAGASDVIRRRAEAMEPRADGVFDRPFEYTVKLSKGSKCKASVEYATDGKRWYWGVELATPIGGVCYLPSTKKGTLGPEATAAEAVVKGLEFIQDHADEIAERASAATVKKQIQLVMTQVGLEIAAILKAVKADPAESDGAGCKPDVFGKEQAIILGTHWTHCGIQVHKSVSDSGKLKVRVAEPNDCFFRYTEKKRFACALLAFEKTKMARCASEGNVFPQNCPLGCGVVICKE